MFKLISSFVLSILLLTSCGKTSVGIGVEIIIPFNKEVRVMLPEVDDHIDIKFIDYSDSRCPEGAYCYTIEEVKATVLLDKSTTFNFEQTPYKGYNINFLDVKYKKDKGNKKNNANLHIIITKP